MSPATAQTSSCALFSYDIVVLRTTPQPRAVPLLHRAPLTRLGEPSGPPLGGSVFHRRLA